MRKQTGEGVVNQGRGRKVVAALAAVTALTACSTDKLPAIPTYGPPTLHSVGEDSAGGELVCFNSVVVGKEGQSSITVNPVIGSVTRDGSNYLGPKMHLSPDAPFLPVQPNSYTWYTVGGDGKLHEGFPERCASSLTEQKIDTITVKSHGKDVMVNVLEDSEIKEGSTLKQDVRTPMGAVAVGGFDLNPENDIISEYFSGLNLDPYAYLDIAK
jgi:hypothetical protein